jgi:hypothetical protein
MVGHEGGGNKLRLIWICTAQLIAQKRAHEIFKDTDNSFVTSMANSVKPKRLTGTKYKLMTR